MGGALLWSGGRAPEDDRRHLSAVEQNLPQHWNSFHPVNTRLFSLYLSLTVTGEHDVTSCFVSTSFVSYIWAPCFCQQEEDQSRSEAVREPEESSLFVTLLHISVMTRISCHLNAFSCVRRLVYWVAAAFGSSVRGFGFGLSFLPSVAMMFANFYFIFAVEAAGSIFSRPPLPEALAPPSGKQRFWG